MMTQKVQKAQKAMLALLQQQSSFNLVSHVQPDGDSIGSLLALGEALEKMGKTCLLYTSRCV